MYLIWDMSCTLIKPNPCRFKRRGHRKPSWRWFLVRCDLRANRHLPRVWHRHCIGCFSLKADTCCADNRVSEGDGETHGNDVAFLTDLSKQTMSHTMCKDHIIWHDLHMGGIGWLKFWNDTVLIIFQTPIAWTNAIHYHHNDLWYYLHVYLYMYYSISYYTYWYIYIYIESLLQQILHYSPGTINHPPSSTPINCLARDSMR